MNPRTRPCWTWRSINCPPGESLALQSRDERVHDLRIELSPGAAAQLRDRFFDAVSGAVWPHRDQRAIDITDRDNSRTQGNCLARELIWIARSVPAFSLCRDHWRDRGEQSA